MSKRMYEDLKETLNEELRALAKKGELSRESLDSIYKLTETIKAIDHIMKKEMEGGNSSEPGYSMRPMMSYDGGNQSMRGGSYEGSYNQGSYNQGGGSYNQGSYERGGNNRGSNRGSYGGGSYEGSYEGGSNRGSYEGSYEGGGSNRGSYESYGRGNSNEGSYARRGRDADSDSRYSENRSSRDYSRHSSTERMIQKLEMMMDEASTEKEREAIRRCMEQLDY